MFVLIYVGNDNQSGTPSSVAQPSVTMHNYHIDQHVHVDKRSFHEGILVIIYRITTNFGEANIWRLVKNLQSAEF